MNEVLIDTLIDKVDAQERKIGDQENQINELRERVDSIPDNSEVVSRFNTSLQELRSDIKLLSFPEKPMRDLSARLETTMMILKQPVKKEIVHHHHATKTIWIAAALFLMLCLFSAGWYNTYNKLETYIADDTKYRYLNLEAPVGLKKWLGEIDSLYIVDREMRNKVIAREEQNQRNFEIMQRSIELEKEAKELKKKVIDHRKKSKYTLFRSTIFI